jgi:hypothetical protein
MKLVICVHAILVTFWRFYTRTALITVLLYVQHCIISLLQTSFRILGLRLGKLAVIIQEFDNGSANGILLFMAG